MGTLIMFEAEVTGRIKNTVARCKIEVLDNHGIPEVRVGPTTGAHEGWTASFENGTQFEEFVDSVNQIHERLRGIR